MLKSDHLFAQQLYFMLKIESTFNRIETLGQLILSFLIEIFVKEVFLYVIVLTSIRLKKNANRNPLMYTIKMIPLTVKNYPNITSPNLT